MERVISFVGLFVMIGLAWLMSSNKRKFPWRVVIGGLILQFIFAGLMFASRDAPALAVAQPAAEAPAAPQEEGAQAAAEAQPVEKAALDATEEKKEERKGLLRRIDDGFNALINCVDAGSSFMFGKLLVTQESVFAFRVLPSIIFF